ncbi:hypothetical protein BDR26DRAFT_822931 [Obelidium mucronatum]|nr:hypothetical protein BDR26DRAFT_822931 [Obelidium mucronatum]
MSTIWCVLKHGAAFSVSIDPACTVYDLKKAIFSQKTKELEDLDAGRLTLIRVWKGRTPGLNQQELHTVSETAFQLETYGTNPEITKEDISALKTIPGAVWTTNELCFKVMNSRKNISRYPVIRDCDDDELIHIVVLIPPAGPSSSTNNDLKAAPCEIDFFKTVHLATQNEAQWLSFRHPIPSSSLSALLLRDSFLQIAHLILHESLGVKKFIVTGTPGIGKSLFLVYLLYQLLVMKKRVLFYYHPNVIYYDGNGGVFTVKELPIETGEDGFWNQSLWVLFDAKQKEPRDLSSLPYNSCNFVMSLSPRRDLINDFQKPPQVNKYFMPVWSQQELQLLANRCFAHLGDSWMPRFSTLGGIPRFVLEVTNADPMKMVRSACGQCTLDDCIKVVGLNSDVSEKTKVVHLLIHIKSEYPFTEHTVEYASLPVLKVIVKEKGDDACRKMKSLLGSCRGNPLTAALCGYIFEMHAITELERGGTFRIRNLIRRGQGLKGGESTLIVPPSIRELRDSASANDVSKQLYVPNSGNHVGLDAWMSGVGGFQMTVGRKHGYKSETTDLLDVIGGPLYMLLPPLYFGSFPKSAPNNVLEFELLIEYPEGIRGFEGGI